ncbi:MAG TPA: hypothetical protein GX747_00560 [Tenericutes bacterium]|nr:hypothetical protein [Mycoplasmatota bacterium]
MNRVLSKKNIYTILFIILFILCLIFFSEREKFKRDIIVNEVSEVVEIHLDYEEKNVDYNDLIIEYGISKNLDINNDYKFSKSFCRYIKENKESKSYDLLWDCNLIYGNKESIINISFSKQGHPLRKYVIESDTLDVSIFKDTVVTVSKCYDNYMVNFQSDGVYYDITTFEVDEKEVIDLVADLVLKD